MSWLRIDTGFWHHPKFGGWKATQKWAFGELLGYCAEYRTGGIIPTDLSLLPRGVTTTLLTLAEQSGWIDRDETNRMVIHDWKVYNPDDPTAAERNRAYRQRNADRNGNRNESVPRALARAPVTSRIRKEPSSVVESVKRLAADDDDKNDNEEEPVDLAALGFNPADILGDL